MIFTQREPVTFIIHKVLLKVYYRHLLLLSKIIRVLYFNSFFLFCYFLQSFTFLVLSAVPFKSEISE